MKFQLLFETDSGHQSTPRVFLSQWEQTMNFRWVVCFWIRPSRSEFAMMMLLTLQKRKGIFILPGLILRTAHGGSGPIIWLCDRRPYLLSQYIPSALTWWNATRWWRLYKSNSAGVFERIHIGMYMQTNHQRQSQRTNYGIVSVDWLVNSNVAATYKPNNAS